jgi:uncharacterized protein (TIGR02147 family)
MQSAPQPSQRVYEYRDYRLFLRDRYLARKEKTPSFSYRYIAGKLGLDSGTVCRIFKGKRNLDPGMAGRMARVFGLSEQETGFFETLVLFGQAKSQAERNHFLERIFKLRGGKANALEERQYVFYRQWFHLALRELLNFYPFDGDYKRLAKMLRPAIRPEEAKKALRLLLDTGLVKWDERGRLYLAQALITSGESIPAVFLNNLHQAMADLAVRALPEIDPVERDFSGLTVSLSPEGFRKIKARTKEYRREILEITQQDRNVDCVYRINLQVFPISNRYWPGSR